MFLQQIPLNPKENLAFRADLHEYLAGASKQARSDFVEMCRVLPPITFKTMLWTEQPKPNIRPYGVWPFITWDSQDGKIREISYYMAHGGIIQIGKSREVGATWIILGCGLNRWLFTPRDRGLLVSWKEEIVDKKGNTDTLYYKLDFMLERLPIWATPGIERTERHLRNLWNESVIDGEATVKNVGRGGRRTWSFCDEFPAIDYPQASAIDRTLTDTASCRIFLGTSEYESHPFNKIGSRKGTVQYFLGWWGHPFKARGLYFSPDINKIIIEDMDYYRKLAPEVFNKYEKGQEITYSELEEELLYKYPELKISFVADGGNPEKPKWRSPWYDNECEIRDPMDVAVNLDGNAIGGGDKPFSQATINQMLDQYVKNPSITGEVVFDIYNNKVTGIKFIEGGRGRLKWWGDLAGARPPQNHNFVLGGDISLGQGQSNSVCSIFDTDERIKVGCWSDSYTLPEQFAEQVYALGRWVGGASVMPLLNFEANGIGQVFLKRVRELGYTFIYKSSIEKKGMHEKSQILGWWNNPNNLLALFASYNGSMTACFRPKMTARKFVNPDRESLREATDYIFQGKQIVLSSCIEDFGGAKAAHGDRVIADALCNLAAQDQPKAAREFASNIYGTSEWFEKRFEREQYEKENRIKVYLDF